MALSLFWTKTINGFDGHLRVPDAYCRISRLEGDKESISFSIDVCRDLGEGLTAVDGKSYTFTPSMDGENFIKQAYLYLKTLPEFADAVDC